MNLDRSGPILCFGEMLLRLNAPPGTRLPTASVLEAHVGGAEANAAAMLAQLGHAVNMVTVLPKSSLGDLCEAELRRTGIGTDHVVREDGRLGLYFLASAFGSGGEVIYDRKNSVFAEHADAFEWQALAEGSGWLHLSGINLALGERPSKAALAAAQAMKAAGVPVSFDVNHRASLWQGRSAEASGLLRQAAEHADLLFASPRDVALLLGDSGVAGDHRSAADAAFDAFAHVQLIASLNRQFEAGRQLLTVRIDDRQMGHETAAAPLHSIIDRIGSGDAFAGAVIDAILGKASLNECAGRGLAAAVSKHSIVGDRWVGSRAELHAYDPFAAQDVQR